NATSPTPAVAKYSNDLPAILLGHFAYNSFLYISYTLQITITVLSAVNGSKNAVSTDGFKSYLIY
ncbi:MAG: hypothetical protein ACI81I_000677, partial [Arcobacteraceae bacterium]